jgi:hypothetical protein
MANVGSGTGTIWRDTTGTNPKTFNLKTLVAGANITITNGTDTITIAATDTDTQYLMANVGSGTGTIWRDTTGTNPKTFNLKTLVAGANITITNGTDTITIAATDTDTQYLMANVGSGTGTIWRDTTGTNPKTFNLKTLVAGANITITNGTDTITIAATDTDTQYLMANVGTGTGQIWRDTTGTNPKTFNLKTLVAGANITITNGTDAITIAATDTDTQYLMNNLGTGAGIWSSTTGTNPKTFNLKSLVAGANVTITSDTNTITISSSYVDTDTQYLMANVGTGTGQIWRDTTGTNPKTFNLKTLVAGANITITNGTDTITIAATDTDTQYLMANVGSGTGTIWRDTTGTNPKTFNLKTLVAGANITITNGTDAITIAATDTDTQYLMNNLGTGAGIWSSTTGTNPKTFNLKSLVAGANVTITSDTNTITISSSYVDTDTQYLMANVGTGTGQIWRDTTGTNPKTFNLKTLVAGANITITNGTDTITIAATDTDTQYLMANVGSGTGTIWRDTTGTNPKTFNLKTLVAGANITITNGTDAITIAANVPSPPNWSGTNIDCSPPPSDNGSAGVYKDTVGYVHRFRRIHGAKLIRVIENSDCITIVGKEPTIEYLSCSTGTGEVYYDRIWRDDGSGDTWGELVYRFRRIKAGSGISITQNNCDITISATVGDPVEYLMANVGSGTGTIWRNTTGTNPKTFNLKTLVAGANITITNGTDTITIAATDTDTQYNVNNLGPGLGWYAYTDGTNPKTLNFRSIVAGNNIILSHTSDRITIAAKSYEGNNVGPGYGIYRDTTGTDPLVHNFRSLVAGPGISITDSPDFLLISAPGGGGGGNADYVERWGDARFIKPTTRQISTNVDPDVTYHVPLYFGCPHILPNVPEQWIRVQENSLGTNHYWYIENLYSGNIVYEVKIFLYIRVDDACFDPPSNGVLPVIPLKPQLRLYYMDSGQSDYDWDLNFHLTNATFWDLLDVYTELDVWQQVYVNTQDALMSPSCVPINPCLTKFMQSMLPRHYYIRLEGSTLIPANEMSRNKWFPVFGYDQRVRGTCRPIFTLVTGYFEIKLASQSSYRYVSSDGPCAGGNPNPFSW